MVKNFRLQIEDQLLRQTLKPYTLPQRNLIRRYNVTLRALAPPPWGSPTRRYNNWGHLLQQILLELMIPPTCGRVAQW